MSTTTTTAITHRELGGPEVLTAGDVELAPPGDGEVTVRVQAAGVNPIDAKLRAGIRPSGPFTEPRRVGADAAGIVTSVGPGVEGLRVGDAVVIAFAGGTYAAEVTLDAAKVTPRPPQVSAAEGAGIGIPFATAYQALRSLAVGSDDTLLVHGGSGAVGQAIIQFAVLWGARVIATTSDARADRVRALGAEPVAYGDGLADRVRDLAEEVTVAIDAAGTDEALQVSLDLVADRDRIATIVRGADADDLGIRAFSGGSPHPLTAQQLAWRTEAIPVTLALLAAGRASVEIGPHLPLDQAAEAHRLLEAGTVGKIVLVP
ncbi:quinone oxidoreductase family protein [Microbacterium sp. bgisy189]|uniref:quinone oxidoreductase family protein n=1 Tax=Microbacterium sp. bgisy189 TaxID=3413798 RepID=UPI003EB8CF80